LAKVKRSICILGKPLLIILSFIKSSLENLIVSVLKITIRDRQKRQQA
jgi:hypothetical protein